MRLAFRRLPIRLRLTIAFAGVLAAVLAVGGLVLFTQFRSDFDNLTGANLSSRAADAAALVASGEPRAALTRSQERLAQVYDARGRLVASTPALSHSRLLTPEQARRAARGRLRLARVQVPAGATTVSAHAAKAFGGPLAVAVAEPLDRRDQALDRLAELLLIVGPLALVLATYAGYQVAGAALGPVERMRARAEQITERDTAERLPVPATNDEIEELGHTLNALLGRLDEALGRERRLLSEASHELRTPLTVLLTEVQVALRGDHDADELREALESVGHEAKRLSRLADDLLTLARADAGHLPVRPERLDAEQILAAAAQRASAAGRLGTFDHDRREGRHRGAGRPGSGRAGARQPRRERPRIRRRRHHTRGHRLERSRGAARDRPGARVPRRLPRARLRALPPRRQRADGRGSRARPSDRRDHRPGARRRGGRAEPIAERR